MPTGIYAHQGPRIPDRHPDRKHNAHGLCMTCYSQQFRKRKPDYHREYEQRRPRTAIQKWKWRDTELRRLFGITLGQYIGMAIRQEGRCAICRGLPNGRWPTLMLDHDHQTGAVRALLCNNCNRGLGFFLDNLASLHSAADYLEKWRRPRSGA